MKNLVILQILLVFFCVGCIEKKVATQHGFYSTTAPSIAIKFNDEINYIGEERQYGGKVMTKTYYYAGENSSNDSDKLSFISVSTLPNNWYWYPKSLPTGNGPYTNVYVKEVDGEDFYCRTITSDYNIYNDYPFQYYKEQGINLPDALEGFVCTKKVSSNKKATFAYLRKSDRNKVNAIFNNERFDPDALTSEQINYFNSVEKELSAEIMARKFMEGDI